jgi:hypothetical protein
MNPQDLVLLITRQMPFGKNQSRLIADLRAITSSGSHGLASPKASGRRLTLMQEIDHDGLGDMLAPMRRRPASAEFRGAVAVLRR